LQNNSFEVRAFSYLDIISWLESKIYDKRIQDIIRGKYVEAYGKRDRDLPLQNQFKNPG
jgi:hypothetical protein